MIQQLFCGIQPAPLVRFNSGKFPGGVRPDILTPPDSAGTLKNSSGFFDVFIDSLPGAVAAWIRAALKDPHGARLL